MNPDPDDLMAICGVTLPEPKARRVVEVGCGHTPPKARPTFAVEGHNLRAFVFQGYVARVDRLRCSCCDEVTDVLQGIFIAEIHEPSGTRRLTRMVKGTDWPAAGGHAKEVTEREVDVCGGCVTGLGFDRIVGVQPWTLIQGEGKAR